MGLSLTRVLQPEVRLGLGVAGVEDLLADVLGEQLVQRVVDGQRQRLAARRQPRRQQRVQVVGGHHVVLPSGGNCVFTY